MSVVPFVEEPVAATPIYSEAVIADRFAGRHANELRYVARWNRWMRYTGYRWDGGIQQPRVYVPLIDRRSHTPMASST